MLDDLRRTLTGRYGTADERAAVERASAGRGERRRAWRVVVPVWFHAITDGATGRVSRARAREQIGTLNRAYGGGRGGIDTGVTFRLAGLDTRSNRRWFRAPERYERAMKKALRKGGPGTLNLYTAAVGTDLLGFSTFPQWYREDRLGDGVVIDYRTLPGGVFRHFDRGFTAAHEIGHWLGLFHTFENGCAPPGDGVGDTPYEARPADGCPKGRNTCRQPGRDPVRNFMNYGWDDCMREFTKGQGLRIRASWAAYRSPGRPIATGPDGGGGARSVGGAR
ncbi:zinc metalloprotease [Spirillospora sp. CA-255316]